MEGKMKLMKKIIITILFAGMAFGAWYFFFRPAERKAAPEIQTVDIEGTIRDIGELATAEYGYTITQIMDKPGRLSITSSRVLYSYDGIIKAGIDFSGVEITTNKSKKTIYVKIPPAKILSNELDNDSLVVYDEKYSLFNTVKFEDMNLSQADAKRTAEEKAIESGLLERAGENARNIIEKTVFSLRESDEYQVSFR